MKMKQVILYTTMLAILGMVSAQAVKISGTFTLADRNLKVPAGGTAYVDGQAYGPGTYPWPPSQKSVPSSMDNKKPNTTRQKTKTPPHTFGKTQRPIPRNLYIATSLTLIAIPLTIYATIKVFQEWQKDKKKHEQNNDNDSTKKLSTI